MIPEIPEIPEIKKTYIDETQELQESLLSSPLSQALHLSPLLSPIAPVITLTLQEFNRISDYYDSARQQISSLEQQREDDAKSYKALLDHDRLLGTVIADQIGSLAQSSLDFSEVERFALRSLQGQSTSSELAKDLRATPTSSDFPTLHALFTNPAFALLPESDFVSIIFAIAVRQKLKKTKEAESPKASSPEDSSGD